MIEFKHVQLGQQRLASLDAPNLQGSRMEAPVVQQPGPPVPQLTEALTANEAVEVAQGRAPFLDHLGLGYSHRPTTSTARRALSTPIVKACVVASRASARLGRFGCRL